MILLPNPLLLCTTVWMLNTSIWLCCCGWDEDLHTLKQTSKQTCSGVNTAGVWGTKVWCQPSKVSWLWPLHSQRPSVPTIATSNVLSTSLSWALPMYISTKFYMQAALRNDHSAWRSAREHFSKAGYNTLLSSKAPFPPCEYIKWPYG